MRIDRREQTIRYCLGQGMFRPSFEPVAGRHTEVTAITSMGLHSQRGTVVITHPDGLTVSLPLTTSYWVNLNLQVVAEYQAACDALNAANGGQPAFPGSVADELRKLAELRDAGILSLAEFNAAKARLLG
jgi:Short C-terminal domain